MLTNSVTCDGIGTGGVYDFAVSLSHSWGDLPSFAQAHSSGLTEQPRRRALREKISPMAIRLKHKDNTINVVKNSIAAV